jgi:hypothetical protein
MCDVFEHLNDSREAHRFVSEAKRVLRRGGILFILSPDLMDWKEDFYNCDFSHSNPTTVRRTHQIFMNEQLTTAGFQYAYSGFQGAIGYGLSRVVKILLSRAADLTISHIALFFLLPAFRDCREEGCLMIRTHRCRQSTRHCAQSEGEGRVRDCSCGRG